MNNPPEDERASRDDDAVLAGLFARAEEEVIPAHPDYDPDEGLQRFLEQLGNGQPTVPPRPSREVAARLPDPQRSRAFGAAQSPAPAGQEAAASRKRTRRAKASAATDVALMVRRAAEGDVRAWERLVEQYARLIWAITAEFKLTESDAADVAQTTWMRLLEYIDRIEYPDRVGSWLAATARNECLRSLASRKRVVLARDDEVLSGVVACGPEVDERILAVERDQVRDALSRLPRRWQRLLEMLMADPPVSYAEISDELDLPVGSIGPARRRCLARLRVVLQNPEVSADSCRVSALGDSGSDRDWEVVGELVTGRCG